MNYFSTISFPSFGFEWNPSRSFSIGSLEVHWYGVLIALGMLLAVLYACGRCKEFGLTEDDLIDGVLCIVPFAVICARAYYCIFQWDSYRDNPVDVFKIWEGGLAIYGGVIGAAIGIVVFAWVKREKVRLTAVLDITSLGFLIGQFIGRWGNFINREAFGAETTGFFRMGLENAITGQVTYYHPTFLYESAWNLCGFLLLHFLSKRRKYDGQIALGYVAWYGLGRAFIEGLRTDSLYWGPFRVSQVLAAVSCLAALTVLAVLSFRKHDPAKLFVNVQKEKAAAAEAATAEEADDFGEDPEMFDQEPEDSQDMEETPEDFTS